ncbi:MAG: transposase [Candidatus Thiodiazotropha sp. (ex Lucinoma aequizonata)]|nr:transposase [Candidatus Thiodiazotropha sp. (ex Lucinoma aequizonata)]
MLRTSAERLIYQAVEVELLELLAEHSERRTEDGKAGVVRNGHLPGRELQTGLGPVTVQIPKVRAKSGEPVTFHSALVPPYVRKTISLEAALPWLYLKGISSGEIGEALKVSVGQNVEGMSASTVSRLKQVWAQEYRSWCEDRLDEDSRSGSRCSTKGFGPRLPSNKLLACSWIAFFHCPTWTGCAPYSCPISLIVFMPFSASSPTLALNSGLCAFSYRSFGCSYVLDDRLNYCLESGVHFTRTESL